MTKNNMVKASCCVPRCTNNWRNSPNMKFHTLPSDPKVLGMYEKLIRNANLKKDSSSTRICGAHFPQGERMSRTQLPSIFPWTSVPKERRKIERVQVQVQVKRSDFSYLATKLNTTKCMLMISHNSFIIIQSKICIPCKECS